jgi:hypothetical protein
MRAGRLRSHAGFVFASVATDEAVKVQLELGAPESRPYVASPLGASFGFRLSGLHAFN